MEHNLMIKKSIQKSIVYIYIYIYKYLDIKLGVFFMYFL